MIIRYLLFLLFFLFCSCFTHVYSQNNLLSELVKKIDKQTKQIETENESILYSLKEKTDANPKLILLLDKAKMTKELTDNFCSYIDSLKFRLIDETTNAYSLNKDDIVDESKINKDINIPHRIFVTGDYGKFQKAPEGEVIDKKIKTLKKELNNIIADLWKNGGISNTKFAVPEEKHKTLLMLKKEIVLTSSENYNPKENNNISWSEYTFGKMYLAAILPMLSKFKNDAKTSEMTILKVLYTPTKVESDLNLNIVERIETTAKIVPSLRTIIPLAQKVQKLTDDFHNYIDSLRNRMVIESGGAYTKQEAKDLGHPELEGKPKGKRDIETPTKIFVTGDYSKKKKTPEGPILAKKVNLLKEAYLDLASQLWKDGGIKGTVFAHSDKKELTLKDLKERFTISSDEYYKPENHNSITWSEYTFKGMPVAAVYPMLRKFQNDAITTEQAFSSFLEKNLPK